MPKLPSRLERGDSIAFEDNLVRKISFPVILLVLFSCAVFGAAVVFFQYKDSKNELSSKGERYAEIVAAVLSGSDAFSAGDPPEWLVEIVSNDPEISGVSIVSPGFSFGNDPDNFSEGTLKATSEFSLDTERIPGTVTIFLDLANARAGAVESAVLIFAFFLALAVGIFLFLSARLRALVVEPVNDLSNFVFDYFRFEDRRKFAIRENNEVGRLAQSFNNFANKSADRLVLLNEEIEKTTEELARAKADLKRHTRIDALTKLCNRREFDKLLDVEWRRMQRHGRPVSLILCDIDASDQFREAYGREEQDDCLRELAKIVEKNCMRPADLVVRFGAKTFAALLPETDSDGASAVAERIRGAVFQASIPHEKSTVSPTVTFSFGIGTVVPTRGAEPNYLVAVADSALFESKESGGDKITVNSA